MGIANDPLQANAITPRALALCASKEAITLVPYEVAQKYKILPLSISTKNEGALTCAATRALTAQEQKELCFIASRAVTPYTLPIADIEKAIFCAYHRGDDELRTILKESPNEVAKPKTEPIEWKPRDSHPSQFIATLIEHALSIDASDIHLVPLKDGVVVRLRKNGALLSQTSSCSDTFKKELVGRVRALATMHQHQCDGAFRIPVQGIQASARVSIIKTLHGEKVVIRLFGEQKVTTLAGLGFSQPILEEIQSHVQRTEAALIVGGATGSGKTTTLYALAAALSQQGLSVCSVEDPIEKELSLIEQSCAQEIGYDAALKVLLRQDPDVIMVGELREAQSAKLFFHGASTGHCMLTSLHGGSLHSMLQRLFDLGITFEQLRTSPLALLHQTLQPQLCTHCKVIHLASKGWYAPGCSQCDYAGVEGFRLTAQLLVLTEDLLQHKDSQKLISYAAATGGIIT